MPDFSALEQLINEVSKKVRDVIIQGGHILLLSRPGADGIAATGILAKSIMRMEGRFTIKFSNMFLDRLPSVSELQTDLVFLIDLGEDLSKEISNALSAEHIVIDHHIHEDHGELDIVPNRFGFRGSDEVSTSTLTYMLAKSLSEENRDTVASTIVGSLGARQDICDKRSLCSLNEALLQEAINLGYVETKEGIVLLGISNHPIHESIAFTIDPFITSLAGNVETCKSVLSNAGIELRYEYRWKTFDMLSEDERKKLMNILSSYLAISGDTLESLMGTIFILKQEDEHTPLKEAREFSYLLDSFYEEAELGVSIIMGKRGREVEEGRDRLISYLNKVIEQTRALMVDEKRLVLNDEVAILIGDGIVEELLLEPVSYVVSNMPKFRDKLVLLRGVSGPNGLIAIRNGRRFSRKLNVFSLINSVKSKFEAKLLGHETYVLATLPLVKQKTFIEEIKKIIR